MNVLKNIYFPTFLISNFLIKDNDIFLLLGFLVYCKTLDYTTEYWNLN